MSLQDAPLGTPARTGNGISVPEMFGPFRTRRLPVALALIALMIAPGWVGELARGLMADAYIQVSVFVAATLLIFYGAEKLFQFDVGFALRKARGWQVPAAALLGMLPGCGGAVVVVASYSAGNVGLGAVVAALTATMGDAAFLLIATRPDVAALVLPVSYVVGVIAGYVVDLFDRSDYTGSARAACDIAPRIGKTRARDVAYGAIALPGLVFGILQLAQVDAEASFGSLPMLVAMTGTLLGLAIWTTSPLHAMTHASDAPLTRMAEETAFISIWVIAAYLAYDFTVELTGLDIRTLFQSVGILLPLMGVLVGLIPGCGPQVLVTTLFLNGVIPFSALIANAIANDGDALFPAIALNPKAAVMATIYSALPALLVGYAVHLVFPGMFAPS